MFYGLGKGRLSIENLADADDNYYRDKRFVHGRILSNKGRD